MLFAAYGQFVLVIVAFYQNMLNPPHKMKGEGAMNGDWLKSGLKKSMHTFYMKTNWKLFVMRFIRVISLTIIC